MMYKGKVIIDLKKLKYDSEEKGKKERKKSS